MAGIPLVAGFVSKFYILIGSAGAGGIGVVGAESAVMNPTLGLVFASSLIVSGILNIAYFWPIVYTAFFEAEDAHDAKPLLEFPMGGERQSYGVGVATDGGSPGTDDTANDGYAVDRYPSDHLDTDASTDSEEPNTTEQDHEETHIPEHDHDEHHHHGGPPPGGWERRSPLGDRNPFAESTWLMIAPITLLAVGALVLGVVPDLAVFLELVRFIVEGVTGVTV